MNENVALARASPYTLKLATLIKNISCLVRARLLEFRECINSVWSKFQAQPYKID